MAKKQNFKDMNPVELKKKADELRTELHAAKYSLMAGRSKNVKVAASLRKDIARIETMLGAK